MTEGCYYAIQFEILFLTKDVFMRKLLILLCCVAISLSLYGCGGDYSLTEDNAESMVEKEESFEDEDYDSCCEKCGNPIDGDPVQTVEEVDLCISCAFLNNYVKCKGCNLYFCHDFGDNSKLYCDNCINEKANGCCLCGAWPLDYDELVRFNVKGQEYYMCVDCCADYFANITPMTPCWYCIECGKLFSGKPYPHYLDDDLDICKNCIREKKYRQCKICKKYFNDSEGSICTYCANQDKSIVE